MRRREFIIGCIATVPCGEMLLASPIRSSVGGQNMARCIVRKEKAVEVAYLEAPNGQYILLPSNSYTGIDIMCMPEVTRAATEGCVGRWNGGSRADTIRLQTINNRGISVTNGSNSANVLSGNMNSSELHTISVRISDVAIDKEQFAMGNRWSAYFSNHPFALFGCFNSSTGIVTPNKCRIGRCRIYVGTNADEMAYDFVPMRMGDVGYMYDVISGAVFESEGTAGFEVGPDL